MNFLTVKTRSLLNYNERLFKEKKTEHEYMKEHFEDPSLDSRWYLDENSEIVKKAAKPGWWSQMASKVINKMGVASTTALKATCDKMCGCNADEIKRTNDVRKAARAALINKGHGKIID